MKKKICIIKSVYNEDITNELLLGANKLLEKNDIKNVVTINVPGAFEIPVVISKNIKKYDAFIAIGCIIKGETSNFDLISNAITNGIMQISITQKKPIGNAIITCFNKDQALNRLDKGKEAATAILEVLRLK
tara:strand:- start:1000 stop:1395 length:396 start_codon:yes stop_codon:yes gene_type:complete